MSCKHGFYRDGDRIQPKLYCDITQEICIYSRLCTKPNVNKYILTERSDNCMVSKQHEKLNTPDGACPVRFIKGKYAYVEKDNRVIKVPYDGEEVDYLYITQDSKGTYTASKTKKRKSTRKNHEK